MHNLTLYYGYDTILIVKSTNKIYRRHIMAKIQFMKEAYKQGLSIRNIFGLVLKVVLAKNLSLLWATEVVRALPQTKGVVIG